MSYIKATKSLDYAQRETVFTDPDTNLTTSTSITVDFGADGTPDNEEYRTFTYNEDAQLIEEYAQFDYGADRTVNYETWTDYAYTAEGLLLSKETLSPDWNGDGYADNAKIELHTYNADGQPTYVETTYFYDGTQSPLDYRLESFTYTEDGQLDVTTVDDWAFFDFIVGEDRDYDEDGNLIQISRMDPFDYGDDLYHPEESWTYNADGSVDYSNFSGYTSYGNFAELTTKIKYPSAVWTQELVEGKDADGNVAFRMLDESWSNAYGEVTDILRSYDVNLDGLYTPGSKSGYQDFRDRERMKYSDFDGDGDRDLVSHTVDLHLDKVLDYSMTIIPIDDMVLA